MEKYKLVGYINMFKLKPDFVYPVFEYGEDYYIGHGTSYRIEDFYKLKASYIEHIYPLPDAHRGIELRKGSDQIYIYMTADDSILIGNGYQISKQLTGLTIENDILRQEADRFIKKFDAVISNCNLGKEKYYGTGRRKTSVARVYLYAGDGKITINKRDIDDYFGLETLKVIVRQPLQATGTQNILDVSVSVRGGGTTGQAMAIRHGIARALLEVDNSYRAVLKKAGYLTRDSRVKERKKYGLKAARRAPQYSKR